MFSLQKNLQVTAGKVVRLRCESRGGNPPAGLKWFIDEEQLQGRVRLRLEIQLRPSLNIQSRLKGLLVVRDYYFWAVWTAGPVLKKKIWADYEQLLRPVFSCIVASEV